MKINNKIVCTRLACKVCEHTVYTTTLIEEKHVNRFLAHLHSAK